MSIADDIRRNIKEATKSQPLDDQTKDNFSQAINQLSASLLDKVQSGEIEVTDVKDVKDLSAIFMNLQQTFAGAEGNGAPQASQGVSTYFNDKLNAKKQSPDQDDDEAVVNFEDLNSLSEEDITEMIKKQTEQENADNAKKVDDLA